jgi:hypothetical protein
MPSHTSHSTTLNIKPTLILQPHCVVTDGLSHSLKRQLSVSRSQAVDKLSACPSTVQRQDVPEGSAKFFEELQWKLGNQAIRDPSQSQIYGPPICKSDRLFELLSLLFKSFYACDSVHGMPNLIMAFIPNAASTGRSQP